MTKAKQPGAFKGHRFPPEIISYAVWAYFRFPMSFRDVEDLLYKRGVTVSYETIRSWVGKFGHQYLKGISSGEMSAALKVLLGPDAAGLSANTVSRLKYYLSGACKACCREGDIAKSW
jgi:hypothetical protein